MLNKSYRFDTNTPYNLLLKTDANWNAYPVKVMLIVDQVDSRDLKDRELLSCDDTLIPILNIIKRGKAYAKKVLKKDVSCSFRVFNFKSEKHMHLSTEQKEAKEKDFAVRTISAIAKYKPTHVLFMGYHAYRNCCPCNYPGNRIGWVERLKFQGHECYVTETFDPFVMLDKNGKYSNHLITVALHLAYLLCSKHPFSLEHIQPHPVYVDSKQKFDSMMELMRSSEYVSVDTETKNVTITDNTIYTIQFSSDKTDKGYVLALSHPQTPWNAKQLAYFKRKLAEFFTTENGPILVTMNGKFDMRLLRRYLKIPIITNRLWEITAGEHLLNETMREWRDLVSNAANYGNLRAILCTYQNDFYYRASFTKEDRATSGEMNPSNPDFLKYAAMDVCCLLPIVRMQMKRASYETLKGKNYAPIFKRHMLYEMSDTCHVLSCLDECGSFIDMDYMKILASKRSPFLKQINEVVDQIYAYPATQQANDELLSDSGFKSKGLFGGKASSNNWIFNIRKADHRLKLFLGILKLQPVEKTSTGAPAINKAFIKEYKAQNEVVECYSKYQELYKIYTSYIKSWYTILSTSTDGVNDHHLRPSYGFWDVSTGRISSQKPSLQVIPQHSASAKPLKRAFVAPKGKLLVHYDYSAHEVRCWAIVAGDNKLADAFREGQKLRQQWIENPTDEIKQQMKTHGDIHIQNAHRFFGKWVSKDDPLRQAVKSVIFGVLYQKSARTLGEDTKTGDLQQLNAQISRVYKLRRAIQNKLKTY